MSAVPPWRRRAGGARRGSAAVAAARAHLPLPAALRVLLQPDRLCQTRQRSCPPPSGCGCCARRARSARCSSGFPAASRWRARTSRRSSPRRTRLGFYINLITSGIGMTEARIKALKAGRPRSHPAVLPGQHPRDERFPQQHAHLRPEGEGGGADPRLRLPDGAQRGAAPAQHRPRAARSSPWPSASVRSTSSSPTRSTTAGRGSTARSCCRAARSWSAPKRSRDAFRERVGNKMQIYFVVPDYFETRPKACMSGLGSVFLAITPDGTALPCHAARMLPGLELPNVLTSGVREIWYESPPSTASAARAG